MAKHITSVQVNVLGGVMNGTLPLEPGLNIICGENGTLKTKLLQYIRQNNGNSWSDAAGPVRMQAISPKRNAERRTFENTAQVFRQQNTKLDTLIAEKQIVDHTFDNYPSLGDLFYVVHDDLCKDGGNQREKMAAVTEDFNGVIRTLFPHYELRSQWNATSGMPGITMIKSGGIPVPLEALSLGEQEMLSLILNLHASRARYDVFLIDEPEVHLNWHLEESLFDYFENFCKSYHKQMIVVTHSRAVFMARFLQHAQFLFWNEGQVRWSNSVSSQQRRRIAGEAIEIIRLGDFSKITFFVENGAHHQVVDTLATAIGVRVRVSECGNSANVRSLFIHSKVEGGWSNSFF